MFGAASELGFSLGRSGQIPRTLRLLVVMALLVGCASEEAAGVQDLTPFVPVDPPLGPDDERWGSKGSKEVARVGQVKVMAEDVEAVMNAGMAESPEAALKLALEMEALAQWAAATRATDGNAEVSAIRYRQALVQRFLKHEFEEKLNVETVPFEYIKIAFWAPSIRKRYIHFDAFRAMDVQYLCCHTISECSYDPESREPCFKEGQIAVRELYELLKTRNPETTAEFTEFANQTIGEVHAGFKLNDFAVFYDVDVSYEKNTRVDRATRPVMDALLTMSESQYHKPVRDMFGWHLMFLAEHEPEKLLKPEDPEVRREIAEGIYPSVQKQELMKYLGKQLGTRQVEIRAPQIRALANHGRSEASGSGE